MTTITHSCGNPLYLKDKFCIECGASVPQVMKVKKITEIIPNLFDDLLPYYKKPEIFTGKITDTFHYKRVASDSNMEFSNWWITLQGEDEEQKQINLSSEDSHYDSIKVGDVISVFEPTPLILSRKLKYSSDRHLIKNNDYAGVTIFHKDTGQTSLMAPFFKPDEFSRKLTVLSLIIPAVIIWLSMGPTLESAILGAITGLVLSIICFKVTKRSYLQSKLRYAALKHTIDKILTVSKDVLGYDEDSRTRLNDDLLCPQCEHRNPAGYKFCYQCGHTALATADDQTQSQGESVHALRLKLLNDFNLSISNELVLKRLFLKDWTVQSEITGQLFRVVDRKFGTQVNRWSETTTWETHYKSASTGNTRVEYHSATNHHRTSNLSGDIWVENAAGEIFKLGLPSYILKSADVGNYIFCGWSSLKKGDLSLHSSLEIAINVNKDLVDNGNKMASLNANQNLGYNTFQVFSLIPVFIGWLTGSWQIGLATLVVLYTYLALMYYLKNKNNKRILANCTEPLYSLAAKMREQQKQLLEKLMKLN